MINDVDRSCILGDGGKMKSGMQRTAVATMFVLATMTGGCALDSAEGRDPETSSTESAVTVGVVNYVGHTLWVRSTDSPSGPQLAEMQHCYRFYVDSVDWNTRMAWGYSYEFGIWGWARVSDGDSIYLSAAGC
jgi:hypothetical protein